MYSYFGYYNDNLGEKLVKHVKNNDETEIRSLLANTPDLLEEKHKNYNNRTILHIACYDFAETVTIETVQVLIQMGANVEEHDVYRYTALHYATLGLNPEILNLILKHTMNIHRATIYGDTALTILIDDGDITNHNFMECLSILIKNGVDVNKYNNEFETPIYLAALKKYTKVVKELLKCDDIYIDLTVDIENYPYNKSSARSLIDELGISTEDIYPNENDTRLCRFIQERREADFIELAWQSDMTYLHEYFLTKACFEQQFEVLDYFFALERMDRICTFSVDTPMDVAIGYGLFHVFEYILNNTECPGNVVIRLLQSIEEEGNDTCDHWKCLEIYLKKTGEAIEVNYKDKSAGCYIIQELTIFAHKGAVLNMLNNGSSLANVDDYGALTITDISHCILKDHFDKCIDLQKHKKLKNKFLTFDYKTLLPSKPSNICQNTNAICELRTEIPALLHMSKNSELRPLLKHPLITSFLYLKWQRVNLFCYLNLFLYGVFCTSLALYLLLYYNPSKELENNSVGYFLFLFIMNLGLFCREFFQFIVFPRVYIKDFENYVEMTLNIMVFYLLFHKAQSERIRQQLCAVVILLAAFGFLFILGKYPKFSTNIAMFRTVSYNYIKFLVFYSIIIISFAMCFHTLFRSKTEVKDDNFFVDPLSSIFKTVIMLTGEFESSNIQLNEHPVTSHLIFLAFVFSNAVVLFNLLNGLAVSDVQKIKEEAELYGLVARVEYIAYVEDIIFNDYSAFSAPTQVRDFLRKHMFLPLAKKVCIYPKFISDFKLSITINSDRYHVKNIDFDKNIILEALNLLHNNKMEKKREKKIEDLINEHGLNSNDKCKI